MGFVVDVSLFIYVRHTLQAIHRHENNNIQSQRTAAQPSCRPRNGGSKPTKGAGTLGACLPPVQHLHEDTQPNNTYVQEHKCRPAAGKDSRPNPSAPTPNSVGIGQYIYPNACLLRDHNRAHWESSGRAAALGAGTVPMTARTPPDTLPSTFPKVQPPCWAADTFTPTWKWVGRRG